MINLGQLEGFLRSKGFWVRYQSFPSGFVGIVSYGSMVVIIDLDQIVFAQEAVQDLVDLLGGNTGE